MVSGKLRSSGGINPFESITTNPTNMSLPSSPVTVEYLGCFVMEGADKPAFQITVAVTPREGILSAVLKCATQCIAQYPVITYSMLVGVQHVTPYNATCLCHGERKMSDFVSFDSSQLQMCSLQPIVLITTFCPVSACASATGCVFDKATTCCTPFSIGDTSSGSDAPSSSSDVIATYLIIGSVVVVALEVIGYTWYKRSCWAKPKGLGQCKILRDAEEANSLAETLLLSLTSPSGWANDSDHHQQVNTQELSRLDKSPARPALVALTPTSCSVCLEVMAYGSSTSLKCCGASLHKSCLQQLIASKLRQYSEAHVCPVCYAELFPSS